MAKLLFWLSGFLPLRIISDPEGSPYLERYYLCTLLGWRFYLHRFVGSDPDRGLHDHPWRFAFSIVLSGFYHEETRQGTKPVRRFNWLTGDTFYRVILPKTESWMYVESIKDRVRVFSEAQCWTLFAHTTGRPNSWGFLRKQKDWRTHEEIAVFREYDYGPEGGRRPKDWWKTAPRGKESTRRQRL